MNEIDIKVIIEKQGLNIKEVAAQLFPGNSYPKLALDRVIKGKAFLDSNQISKLSFISRMPIQFLYSNSKWDFESKRKEIRFSHGEYVGVLNTFNNITKIYHNKSLFHESIIHKSSIPLSEYLEKIEQLIINYNNKKQ